MRIYCEDLDEEFCVDVYLTLGDLENLRSGIMISRDTEMHGCIMSIGIIPTGEEVHDEREEEESE